MQKIDRTGETNIAKNGLKMTIVCYRDANNIDIQFEDGYIAKNLKYGHFKIGNIGHPDYPNGKVVRMRSAKEHIGETNYNTNGLLMTIIEYKSNHDISVKFEDGIVIQNRTYFQFIKGTIAHPKNNKKNQRKHIIGDISYHTSGMKIEIVGYSDRAGYIKVRFEDGYETECSSSSFVSGEVRNPNINEIETRAKQRVGMKILGSCGLSFTVTDYKGTHDVSIKWEDNEITEHTRWTQVATGEVGHPNLHTWRWSNYKCFRCRKVFKEDSSIYYRCKCNICNEENILTPQQMIAHSETHTDNGDT